MLLRAKATSWSMFGGNKTKAVGDYDENELCFQAFTETKTILEKPFLNVKEHA
ncbi:hypothetical protein [Solibacillus daqui]|uniref:hypothetical protein n=1 Tax=Solibacillus daqui TaxID=2912187 RepID=UPI00236652E7|nr:hypothetical protein [Solibacillus daqui]